MDCLLFYHFYHYCTYHLWDFLSLWKCILILVLLFLFMLSYSVNIDDNGNILMILRWLLTPGFMGKKGLKSCDFEMIANSFYCRLSRCKHSLCHPHSPELNDIAPCTQVWYKWILIRKTKLNSIFTHLLKKVQLFVYKPSASAILLYSTLAKAVEEYSWVYKLCFLILHFSSKNSVMQWISAVLLNTVNSEMSSEIR